MPPSTLQLVCIYFDIWFSRISIIFKIKSAQKIKMTDHRLAKRMIPIVCCATVFCITWTMAARSRPVWLKTVDGLKYLKCSVTWCDYASFGGSFASRIWEDKISLRQRQREQLFVCADVIIYCVLPWFLFVIVVVDDKMEAMSRSS